MTEPRREEEFTKARIKDHFEANILDGNDVKDCGEAMLQADNVLEYIQKYYQFRHPAKADEATHEVVGSGALMVLKAVEAKEQEVRGAVGYSMKQEKQPSQSLESQLRNFEDYDESSESYCVEWAELTKFVQGLLKQPSLRPLDKEKLLQIIYKYPFITIDKAEQMAGEICSSLAIPTITQSEIVDALHEIKTIPLEDMKVIIDHRHRIAKAISELVNGSKT